MTAAKAAPATAPRERRNREVEVLDAAIDLFHRKGYAAASIQDVADRVGVLKGSVYYYIDSKEDLLFRIFAESHRQASAIVEDATALEGTPLQQLRSYIEHYVLWYLENVERVSLYFSEGRHLTGDHRDTVREQGKLYQRFLRGRIDAAKKAGEVPADLETRYAANFILGAINGVPAWYRRGKRDRPRTVARAYADMVLAAVQTKGET